MTLATKLEAYIEGLTLSQGRYAGQLFKLLPWEKRFLRGRFVRALGTRHCPNAPGRHSQIGNRCRFAQ